MNKKKDSLIGFLLILLSSISFSSKSVMVKLVYVEGVDAVTALFLRMSFSLPIFLFIFLFNRKKNPLSEKDFFQIFLLGFLGYYLSSILDFWGLVYISAGLERLILFIYPTIVILISAFLFNRKISKLELVSLLLSYLGIIIVFSFDKIEKNQDTYLGVALIFVCAITYAIYLIGSGEIIPKVGATIFTSLAMTTACISICIHFAFTRNFSSLLDLSPKVYLLGFMMSIITTIIPTFLLSWGIKRIGSGTTAIIGTIGPVSTIFLAWIFLNETLELTQWIGTAFVIAGVFLVSQKK